MTDLYIGLMSSTSVDGIDTVLVDFAGSFPLLIGSHYTAYPPQLRSKILGLCQQGENEIERLGELDVLLGNTFGQAINQLLTQHACDPALIKAIGSHGQTIRHSPHAFTLQIGDPNVIAARTGITTIADFRRKDMAHGGQGAPLVPAFHQHILADHPANLSVVNIGGIANVTLLPQNKSAKVIGFDTGPGNILMDAWIDFNQHLPQDTRGEWAAKGNANPALLTQFLSDSYFTQPLPKSTGREYFNLSWLKHHLASFPDPLSPIDIQATLAQLTASSILAAIQPHFSEGEILICGGGIHNDHLMACLQSSARLNFTINSTQKYGIDPDWVEAMAFAWLARQTLAHQSGNIPSVTGAARKCVLGGVYLAG
jgi:anhydro-N-acetylmuramic acid kinase